VSDEEVKDLEREKKIIDREVELYRREKQQEVQSEVRYERQNAEAEARDAKLSAREKGLDGERAALKKTAELETTFLTSKSEKDVELAKLDAEIESKKDLVKKLDSIPELEKRTAIAEADSAGKDIAIDHLKADITRLDEFVKFIAGLIPKVELDKLNFSFNADVTVNQAKGGEQKKEEKKPQ